MSTEGEAGTHGMVEDFVKALSDKQSQLDLHLQGLTLTLGDSHLAIRLTGTVTVSVHMRDLTDAEKDAYAMASIAQTRD